MIITCFIWDIFTALQTKGKYQSRRKQITRGSWISMSDAPFQMSLDEGIIFITLTCKNIQTLVEWKVCSADSAHVSSLISPKELRLSHHSTQHLPGSRIYSSDLCTSHICINLASFRISMPPWQKKSELCFKNWREHLWSVSWSLRP